jgi:thiamine kinase-like enzyme
VTEPVTDQLDDLAPLLDRVPGWRGRARVVGALEGGITNRNYLVEVSHKDQGGGQGTERFVLRLAGKDTHLLGIDRAVERAANEQAAGLGIAPEVYAFLEPEGYLVTRFVPGAAIELDQMRKPDTLAHVARVLRTFHDSPAIAGVFDCFRVPEEYARTAAARGVRIPETYERAEVSAHRIEAAFAASPEPAVPCHNDLLNANFLLDASAGGGGHVWLLDWEYAGMNDRWFDLGNFATNNELDTDAERALVAAYFGAVSERHLARLVLMKVMSDLREAMWGVVQQGVSTLDFDYVDYADRHFNRLLGNAGARGFERLLDAAATPDPGEPDAREVPARA